MTKLTRRGVLKYGSASITAGALAHPFSLKAQSGAPVAGGQAVVAMSAATETVDPHFSRSQAARNVLMHMCETLVTIDERGSPQLQLAEDLKVSEDSRVYTFRLRGGVPFHNGKEMTSADAKASLERYARVSPEKVRLANVDRITTPDSRTLVVELKKSMPSWIELIKSPASPMTIIPLEECGKEANNVDPISTGPYRFVEWDGVTRLTGERFDDYAPNTAFEGRDGYGGRRTAYFVEISFRVASEASSRIAGLQSGAFDIIDDVPVQAALRLDSEGSYRVFDHMTRGINVVPVNIQRPPTDKLLVRQAIQRVLNVDDIMTIATDGAFRLNPSFVYPTSEFYPADAEDLVYNANDVEGARALLKEAGYNGEELVILTSSDIASLEEVAVVMSEQLKSIGMNVKLNVLDWPGANAQRADPTTHNMFSTAYAIQPLLGPFQYQRLVSGKNNWSFYEEDTEMEAAWDRLLSATDLEGRKQAWRDIEFRINSQVYQLKMGDRSSKQASTMAVQNFKTFDSIRLWDIWKT